MLNNLFSALVHTPFYPLWLEARTWNEGKYLIPYFSGRVLETGCGNLFLKERALKTNKKIKEYVATDYVTWKKIYKNHAKLSNQFGKLTELMYGQTLEIKKLDVICDALDLPFKDRTFDTYCNIQVIEHVNNPVTLLKEANRVLKQNSLCIVQSPFLLREHPTKELDFQRITRGGFEHLAKQTGFKIKTIKSYGFFGVTLTALVNQYLIRKFVENGLIIKIVLLPFLPFIFFVMNILGFILEYLDHDDRFAYGYNIVMIKKQHLS